MHAPKKKGKNKMRNEKIQRLAVSAILVAMSTVLSMIPIFKMPLGGSITLFSMVPVCCIAIIYGTANAVLPCFIYAVIQILIDGVMGWGLTPAVLIGAIFFDFIFAYGALALSGLFREKGDEGIIVGIVIALTTRFLCHFVSGCIFFRTFDVFDNPYIYSLAYNGAYMLPELVFTVVAVFILTRMSFFKHLVDKA